MIGKWIIGHSEILAMKRRARKAITGRQERCPLLEGLLKTSFDELRELGRPVKARWFVAKAKELFKLLYPQSVVVLSGQVSYGGFKFSKLWFQGFQRRQHISLRKRTNHSQKQPEEFREEIQSFHQFIRKFAEVQVQDIHDQFGYDVGQFKLRNIANMDQTTMPFEIRTDSTYNTTAARTVWVKSLRTGLDKRQVKVQLTVHTHDIASTSPMIVFRGKGLHITSKQKQA